MAATPPLRVVCVSDTHGVEPLPEIPPCDLLLFAGDSEDKKLPSGGPEQRGYFSSVFVPWLERAPARHKVGIAGNHDRVAVDEPELLRSLPWHYLEDEAVEIEGLKIYGSPWVLPFHDWAFNLPEHELAKKWELIPSDCDILLTHVPGYGYGDDVSYGHGADPLNPHAGSSSLRYVVERHQSLRLHVFGHIHQGYGQGLLEREGLPALPWVNASSVSDEYVPGHAPVVVEL
jgi:hypothetical protein